MTKGTGFCQSADLKTTVSLKKAKSPAVSDLTKNSSFQSPEKASIANSRYAATIFHLQTGNKLRKSTNIVILL